MHFTLTVLLSTQEYKWVVANYRFTVKSPESHVARSHVARNLSHVARNFSYVEDFDYTEINRMLGIEISLSNDSKSVVRF